MRRLSPEARQERRRQVIRLHRQGWTYEAIGAELGLSRTGVFDICKRFDEGVSKALADKPCGRHQQDVATDGSIGKVCRSAGAIESTP